MTVIDVQKNPEALTLTLTARFDAPPARVWQVWEDPRKLERWWGPPTYPATVVDHELKPGGAVTYFMTGPEGDKHHGWWRIRSVEAPYGLEFEDGFADDAGRPNPDMPTMSVRVRLAADGETSTVMTVESTFPTAEAMEQLVSMGMVEGITAAMGQIDALLADSAA
ncbi:SRPBCC family protein [Streptomyces sporangiiformans]|uniref:SRPBCC domain-containing protein n=1 Tax=Streptomyces sporangiiformans TaxID=2315329 RepID=A0A505D119_9ACTN|nr:SRPBCC domain-containing protein [Streptomyces sporangiiformans]TPQ16457.1 SRPBCC domain-containing protein [Streptomyces sporangiiformans]